MTGRIGRGTATRLIVALCLAVLVVTPVSGASDKMRWGYSNRGQPTSKREGAACVSSTKIWVQELGKSGITRLKAKFERRGPYDPGIPGTSYSTNGWYYSGAFPDDYLSYWATFYTRFRHFPGGVYKIRAVMVGERPSFWKPDVKIWADLAPTIGCEGGTIVTP
jgi:hypothetical protein